MDGWPRTILYELVDFVTGGTPRTGRMAYWGGDIPWVTATDLTSGKKSLSATARSLTQEGLWSMYGRTVPPGTVIISSRGTVGLLAVAAKDMAINQSCYGLIAKPNKLDQNFLYYLMKMVVNDLSLISHGSIFESISKKTFKEVTAPVPPLDVQKRIAALLSGFDEKIEILSDQNITLEALAALVYYERINPLPGVRIKLDELARISSGRHIDRSLIKPEGTYPVYGPAGLMGRADKYFLETDLIFTGRVGTLGRVWMLKAPKRAWLTENTLYLKNAKYLHLTYFFLKNSSLPHYNSGSSQPLLRRSDLAEMEIRVPCEKEAAAFEIYAGHLFDKIQANEDQLESLIKLRDYLMVKLISGKLWLDP
ncbi:MAG: restriction endonuclease subunit S [Deltaproteobacteria bacterium]|jgi:type I restriction enzyme S subunit|nr:restriction endonuclease subunit S [Deltaproteobacteria bacterium]